MYIFFKRLFPDRWKFHAMGEVRRSTAMGYSALAVIRRGDLEERLVRMYFKCLPTKGDIKRHAKSECRRLNGKRENDAFYLVEPGSGEKICVLHGNWKNAATFEIKQCKVMKEGVCLLT